MRCNTREVRHVNPWNNPDAPYRTYAEYEDDFRDLMAEAGLPWKSSPKTLNPRPRPRPSKEFPNGQNAKTGRMIASRASFPDKSWMDVKTEIKPGMYAYPAKVEIMERAPHASPACVAA